MPSLWKNGPIHILDHPKYWPIHILPFDFFDAFIAGSLANIVVNSLNIKRTNSLEKSLSKKYVHIPGCQKSGAFHIRVQKNRIIHTLFVEKGGPIIYLGALKKGAIRHAHPYYVIYRKLPHELPSNHWSFFGCFIRYVFRAFRWYYERFAEYRSCTCVCRSHDHRHSFFFLSECV